MEPFQGTSSRSVWQRRFLLSRLLAVDDAPDERRGREVQQSTDGHRVAEEAPQIDLSLQGVLQNPGDAVAGEDPEEEDTHQQTDHAPGSILLHSRQANRRKAQLAAGGKEIRREQPEGRDSQSGTRQGKSRRRSVLTRVTGLTAVDAGLGSHHHQETQGHDQQTDALFLHGREPAAQLVPDALESARDEQDEVRVDRLEPLRGELVSEQTAVGLVAREDVQRSAGLLEADTPQEDCHGGDSHHEQSTPLLRAELAMIFRPAIGQPVEHVKQEEDHRQTPDEEVGNVLELGGDPGTEQAAKQPVRAPEVVEQGLDHPGQERQGRQGGGVQRDALLVTGVERVVLDRVAAGRQTKRLAVRTSQSLLRTPEPDQSDQHEDPGRGETSRPAERGIVRQEAAHHGREGRSQVDPHVEDRVAAVAPLVIGPVELADDRRHIRLEEAVADDDHGQAEEEHALEHQRELTDSHGQSADQNRGALAEVTIGERAADERGQVDQGSEDGVDGQSLRLRKSQSAFGHSGRQERNQQRPHPVEGVALAGLDAEDRTQSLGMASPGNEPVQPRTAGRSSRGPGRRTAGVRHPEHGAEHASDRDDRLDEVIGEALQHIRRYQRRRDVESGRSGIRPHDGGFNSPLVWGLALTGIRRVLCGEAGKPAHRRAHCANDG